MPGRGRSHGCLPRSTPWSRRSSTAASPEILERDEPWYEKRLRSLDETIRKRLADLSRHLGEADWLDGEFSAGDLLMVSVLLRLKASSDMLDDYPNLSAYVARGEARPAYKRAFAAQLAVFTAASAG
jgi:glutathione S-transferase